MGSFANTIFSLLLGWMRGAVSGLWAMLSSEDSGNLLQWLGDNWLGITVILCVVGTATDLLIHLIRWRPYKVWASFFRRLRRKGRTEDPQPQPSPEAPRLRRQWVYPDGNTRTEDVYPAPEAPAPEESAWAAPVATRGSYLQRYAPPADLYPEEEPLMPSPALERMQPPPSPTAEVKGLEDYPPPRSALPVEAEAAPEPISREAEAEAGNVSRPRRVLRRVASLPKSFLIDDDDDELQLHYQPVQPPVDKKQAYHEPVYPPSWRPPADAGAARREEQA